MRQKHQVRSTLFLLRNTNWAQRPLLLSLPCFNVTTTPTKLTSQPPTSQVAKQICYCLSAQCESHASSWLYRKQQTKPSFSGSFALIQLQPRSSTFVPFSWFKWTASVCKEYTCVAMCALSRWKCTCIVYHLQISRPFVSII